MNMTGQAEYVEPIVQEFLPLVKKCEALSKQLKQEEKKLAETMRRLPLGYIFQDPEDGVVYQIMAPSGAFVEFKNIGYIRTRKEGETRGTLSIKAAEDAGFKMKGGE